MTKIEKVQELFELRGTTDCFHRQIESLRHPIPGVSMEMISTSPEEELALLLEMAIFDAKRWTEEELDETIKFVESEAGKKFLDYAAGDEYVKIFNDFLKKKISQLPKRADRPIFYDHGSKIIN